MGGRAGDQRACVRGTAGCRTAGVHAIRIPAARRARGAFRTRPGEGALMDARAGRAVVESEPRSARVESNPRGTVLGASAGVDARR